MPALKQQPRSIHRVFKGLIALCLLALVASSCTKNGDDTECTGCDDVPFEDTPILLESSPEPDTTSIVMDDILIL